MNNDDVRVILKLIIVGVVLGIVIIIMSACASTGKVSTKTQCQTGSKPALINECIRVHLPDM